MEPNASSFNLSGFKSNEWTPWKLSQKETFNSGDIICLDLYGDLNDDRGAGVYKLDKPVPGVAVDTNSLKYNMFKWINGQWSSGHSWNLRTHYTKIRRFLKQPGVIAVSSNGCICRRCNSRNPWANPNQKDGTYLCYECR